MFGAGQKIHVKDQNVHCHCPRHPLESRVYGQATADILQEIRSGGSLGWKCCLRAPGAISWPENPVIKHPTPKPKLITRKHMNMKQIKLFVGAAYGVVALMNLGLQAQTLPITAGLQLWLNADVGVTTNADR